MLSITSATNKKINVTLKTPRKYALLKLLN